MRSQCAAVGMSAKPGMADGKDRLIGEHGVAECGGYHLVKAMVAMGGCLLLWGSTSGEDQRVT